VRFLFVVLARVYGMRHSMIWQPSESEAGPWSARCWNQCLVDRLNKDLAIVLAIHRAPAVCHKIQEGYGVPCDKATYVEALRACINITKAPIVVPSTTSRDSRKWRDSKGRTAKLEKPRGVDSLGGNVPLHTSEGIWRSSSTAWGLGRSPGDLAV